MESPRILVVDDEPDICWALENFLGRAGHEVVSATSGRQALELLARQRCAVVLVDAKLPDLDGMEVARLIRERYPGTSVILISGYYYREDAAIATALQEGLFAGFIAKPFDLDGIRRVVRQAMQKGGEEGDRDGAPFAGG